MSGLMLCGVTGNSDRVAAPPYTWSDTDAENLYNAVGYTAYALRPEIDTFFGGTKTDGVYSKQLAMYLLLTDLTSGTSAQRLVQMKWNALNPVDSDAAKRIVWVSAPNANMNGQAATGFGQYGATKFVPSTHFPNTDKWSFTLYIVDAPLSGFSQEMGAWKTGVGRNTATPMYESSSPNAFVWTSAGNSGGVANNQNGLYTFLVNGSTFKIYRNGSVLQSGAITSGAHADIEVFINGINFDGSFSSLTTRRKCFFSIGDGTETDADISNFHTRINTLQGGIESALSLTAGDRKKY